MKMRGEKKDETKWETERRGREEISTKKSQAETNEKKCQEIKIKR